MRGKKVFGIVVFLFVVLAFWVGIPKQAFPQKIKLTPLVGQDNLSEDIAFSIRGVNIRSTKEDSVIADVVLTNLTGTWFLVVAEYHKYLDTVFFTEEQIPHAFLMGPYQKKEFKDIEFFDGEVLWFDIRRTAPSAFVILTIDIICRGFFSEPLSLEKVDKLFTVVSLEALTKMGEELIGDESGGLLLQSINAFGEDDASGGIQSLAKFVFTIKAVKEQIWGLVKLVWGEEDSIIRSIEISEAFKDLLDLIRLPQKISLLKDIAVATINAPVYVDVRLAAKAQPFIQLVEPLQISPVGPYYVGDTLTATFKVINNGLASIKIQQITVGGLGPEGAADFQDFSPDKDIVLNPGESHSYTGTFQLNRAGKYYFQWAYQDAGGQWKERIWCDCWLWMYSSQVKVIFVLAEPSKLSAPGKPQHADD